MRLSVLALSALAVFAPVKAVLIVAGVLVVSDLILGLLAARKRGEKITSSGIRRTITKLAIYEVAIALGFLAEHFLLQDVPVTKLVTGMVGLTEVLSILENLNVLSGGNLFTAIITRLKLAEPSNKGTGDAP